MPILRQGRNWIIEPMIGPTTPGVPTLPTIRMLGGWSQSRMTGAFGAEGLRWMDEPRYTYPLWTGGSGHKRLTGVAKDSTGAPLAGATCWAYRKDDDVANSRYRYAQEGTVGISAADGAYEVMVSTGDQYGIVSYKSGSPDIAGVTVNTLVGT